MSFLYVCLFSNGHLKVGRSVNALARISQHEERVSCLGVELVVGGLRGGVIRHGRAEFPVTTDTRNTRMPYAQA